TRYATTPFLIQYRLMYNTNLTQHHSTLYPYTTLFRSPAHPGRRDPEGRPERRHRHVHRAGVDPHQDPGALGCGDDRRDHAPRGSAPDRGTEREAARRASRWHQDGADPG